MMKIQIAGIKEQLGASSSFTFACSPLQLDLAESAPWIQGDVQVAGLVTNTGNGLQVNGTISIPAAFACTACLEAVALTLESVFSEIFQEGVEPEEADADWLFYQGDDIDISEMIREHIILSEPLKPICRDDCRGLCSRCGINLNHGTCSCEQKTVDPRLAGLQKLLK
ncbi:DUF177 domain-containing protein [Azotosporobacter soli]|uniref:YceD family protein n=1 Tax=Azotosporobacter soli TaxID=3055040 RepID=UPI0031FEF61B